MVAAFHQALDVKSVASVVVRLPFRKRGNRVEMMTLVGDQPSSCSVSNLDTIHLRIKLQQAQKP